MSARQPLGPIVPLDVALHRVVCSASRLLLAVQESDLSMPVAVADALADLALALYDQQQAEGLAEELRAATGQPGLRLVDGTV